MAVLNGGYAKITKQVFEIGFRDEEGCAWVDYAKASNVREAMSLVARDKRNGGAKIVRVVSEKEMAPAQKAQAMDWLHQRNGY
jgi:hypothetical protein